MATHTPSTGVVFLLHRPETARSGGPHLRRDPAGSRVTRHRPRSPWAVIGRACQPALGAAPISDSHWQCHLRDKPFAIRGERRPEKKGGGETPRGVACACNKGGSAASLYPPGPNVHGAAERTGRRPGCRGGQDGQGPAGQKPDRTRLGQARPRKTCHLSPDASPSGHLAAARRRLQAIYTSAPAGRGSRDSGAGGAGGDACFCFRGPTNQHHQATPG